MFTFEGTLVSAAPADHPSEFKVALSDDKTADAMLKLDGRLATPLAAGTPVIFEGVADKLTQQPFMITFRVEAVNRATVPDKKIESSPKKKSK